MLLYVVMSVLYFIKRNLSQYIQKYLFWCITDFVLHGARFLSQKHVFFFCCYTLTTLALKSLWKVQWFAHSGDINKKFSKAEIA